jgi:hypothetical protein
VHLNVQGLNSSFDDIELLFWNLRPAVIGLCETFLSYENQLFMDILCAFEPKDGKKWGTWILYCE